MTTTSDLQRQALLEIRADNRWSMDRLVSEIGTDAETLRRWVRGDLPETHEQHMRLVRLLLRVTRFLDEYQPKAPVPVLRQQAIKRGLL